MPARSHPRVAPGDVVRSRTDPTHQYVVAARKGTLLALRDPRTGHLASSFDHAVEPVPEAEQTDAVKALREVLA